MNSKRLARVNDEIRKEAAEIIRSELHDPRIGTLTSVTRVETSSDLALAKIYISVLGSDDDKSKVMEGLNSASGFLRKELAHRINLRNTPELRLILDDSMEKAARLDQLIVEANKPRD